MSVEDQIKESLESKDVEKFREIISRPKIYINDALGNGILHYILEHHKDIPIGFIDNKYKPHYKYTNILLKQHEKSTLIYMNFNMKTNPVKRAECYNTFVDKPWVLIESKVLPELFYEKLAMSKYVLSPEGTGVDCHRIYESIFFNSIPILKSNDLDSFYKKLPVITVKEWSDITEDFLIKNYEMYLSNLNKWKLDNKEWTCPKFWLSNYTIPLSELRPPS